MVWLSWVLRNRVRDDSKTFQSHFHTTSLWNIGDRGIFHLDEGPRSWFSLTTHHISYFLFCYTLHKLACKLTTRWRVDCHSTSLPNQLASMVVDLTAAMSSLSQSRRLDWLLPSWLEDAAAYDQSMDENMVTIGYTIAVNTIILFICVISFSVYRMYDDRIFAPKVEMMPDRTPARLSNSTLFAWIKELWDIDDDVIIAKSGYDILFFIRFYRLAFKIFAWFGIYAWGVLLPVNA